MKTVVLTLAVLLSATTISFAQSLPNFGPNAPWYGDSYGKPVSGTYPPVGYGGVPAIPALPSASLWAPISALSILVVTGQSAATSAHWLDVWNVRQGPTLDNTARPFARFASASGYYTLKISAYRFLTVSACESTPSGSSFINLMSASLRTPGFSTVWECGEYWRA